MFQSSFRSALIASRTSRLDDLDQITEEEGARLAEEPDLEKVEATVVMMLFESPPAPAFESAEDETAADDDELADLAPPGSA